MTAAVVMDALEALGVRFALDTAGEVVVDAPRGVLTEERRAALTGQREGIRELLAIVGPACWEPTSGGGRR